MQAEDGVALNKNVFHIETTKNSPVHVVLLSLHVPKIQSHSCHVKYQYLKYIMIFQLKVVHTALVQYSLFIVTLLIMNNENMQERTVNFS